MSETRRSRVAVLVAVLGFAAALTACTIHEHHHHYGTLVPPPEAKATPSPAPPPADDPIVYVTETGEKYHAAGCQYLRKSSIPIRLSQARARYGR